MATTPLGARDRFSEDFSEVETTHERVTITRHGKPAAVLISAEDLTGLEETIDILSTPGAVEAIRQGQADAAAGRYASADDLRREHGLT